MPKAQPYVSPGDRRASPIDRPDRGRQHTLVDVIAGYHPPRRGKTCQPRGSNRGCDERLYHARLACTTLGRGCAALGYGWQNQRKALKGRNKWRTKQTPICRPGQATTRTNAEHCRGGSSIAPPLHLASGNRHTGRWRLLRPFRAIRNVVHGNPGPRDRSQDSRSLALGWHVTAPSWQRDVGSILR